MRRLGDSVGFEILGASLAEDVEASLRKALEARVVYSGNRSPLGVFRDALARSIREIEETDKRVELLQRFLRDMSYEWAAEDRGNPPDDIATARLDADLGEVVKFLSGHMVSRFQGEIAELLAAAPSAAIVEKLQQAGRLPPDARLYAGDTVVAAQLERPQKTHAADFHVLTTTQSPTPRVTVAGVVEVKSFSCCARALTRGVREQIDKHLIRAQLGLRVDGTAYRAPHVAVGFGVHNPAVRVVVVPDRWKLPRTFDLEDTPHGWLLSAHRGVPPAQHSVITDLHDSTWRITLRWSAEALASAAYNMAFWYMGKLGEAIFARKSPWPKMSPKEAGRNASKMMLNLAVGRLGHDRPDVSHAEAWRQYQLAIGLHNAFGFGYALGMNFRNEEDGAREVLCAEDLKEIKADGRTTYRLRNQKTGQLVGPERHCRIM